MLGHLTFVSAGAGSGKTYRLTELLHQRLSDGKASPEGIIATTFTRKAANELRERARAQLLAKGMLDAVTTLDQALIGTVNGVCHSLLKRFCFDAGLSPDLRVIEEVEADALLKECLDEQLDDATVGELAALSERLGIESWREDLSKIISQARSNGVSSDQFSDFASRNADDLLGHFGAPSSDDLDATLLKLIGDLLPKLSAAAAGSKVKKTAAYLEVIESFNSKLSTRTYAWSDWTKLAASTPEAGLAGLVSSVREAAAGYLSHQGLQSDIRNYIELGFRVASEVLSQYAARKRELSALDFTDQEILLLKALDIPAVAAVLAEELDLLLIDEFQDTSPVQLALFMKMTRLAKETYWVGDIKQAIYGFRGSDSDLMDAVVSALPLLGGQTEILKNSWRSRPSLVRLINEVFVPAFDSLPPEQVQLIAQRGELSEDTAYEIWKLEGKNLELRLNALAQQVRALLSSQRQIVDKGSNQLRRLRPGDVAILCRTNARVMGVLKELAVAGIPFAAGHAGLLRRPECVLAMACLRRLNDVEDTIATAEILSLGDCQEPEIWLAERMTYIATGRPIDEWQEDPKTSHPILVRIAMLRAELPMLSPREAIERVVTGCDLAACTLRWSRTEVEARQRIANLDALMLLGTHYEDACRSTGKPGSISGLILWLDKLAKDLSDDQPTLSADAVQVLTHHAAKGLEWPVVILLDLEAEHRDRYWGIRTESSGSLDVAAPLAARFIRFRPWPFGKTTSVPLRDIAATSVAGFTARTAAIDEDRRLLYVSMTRARDLMIFGLKDLGWDDAKWLAVTKAPWLLSSSTEGSPAIPETFGIPSTVRWAHPSDEIIIRTESRASLHWFEPVAAKIRPALFVSPSSAERVRVEATETIPICNPMQIANGFEAAQVGTAIHAAIAASAGSFGPLSEAEMRLLLQRYGVGGCVEAGQLRHFIISLSAWMKDRWPNGTTFAELPIKARTPNGQIARGQIDLMIDSPNVRVILDHKTGGRGAIPMIPAMESYAGQLAAYGRVANELLPSAVTEYWVVVPTAGAVVKLTANPAG